jgi:PST family polysaccharide transporter
MVPHVCWSLKGTGVSVRDVLGCVTMPILAGLVAALIAFAVVSAIGDHIGPFWRIILGGTALLAPYVAMLMLPRSDRKFYLGLFSALYASQRAV